MKLMKEYINFIETVKVSRDKILEKKRKKLESISDTEFELLNEYKLIQNTTFAKMKKITQLKNRLIKLSYKPAGKPLRTQKEFDKLLLDIQERRQEIVPPTYFETQVPEYTEEAPDFIMYEEESTLPPYIGNEVDNLTDYLNQVRKEINQLKNLLNKSIQENDPPVRQQKILSQITNLRKEKIDVKSRISALNNVAIKQGKEWRKRSKERRKTKERNARRTLRRTILRRRRRRENNPFIPEEERLQSLQTKVNMLESDIQNIQNIIQDVQGDRERVNKLERLLKTRKNERVDRLEEIDKLKVTINKINKQRKKIEEKRRKEAARTIQRSFRRERERLQRSRRDRDREARLRRLDNNRFRMVSKIKTRSKRDRRRNRKTEDERDDV